MTDWLKGCEVCNAGLCARFDELISSGQGCRKAARLLEDEQKEILGEVVYSYSSLLNRYYRNKPQRCSETEQSNPDNTKPVEKWPKCERCGQRRVEKDHRTGEPNDNGLCAKCRERIEIEKKLEKGQRKLDQIPIDKESEEYWKQMVRRLNVLFGDFQEIPIGKISEETLDEFNDTRSQIDDLYDKLTEKHVFSILIR
jgi:hypothetical protein